jgi:hypothetical protein
MLDKYTHMTQFEGIQPEQAAATFGFDTGYAYAIRAIPPDGKTQEAQDAEMARVEQFVGHTHLRGLFRRHWLRGYQDFHVCLIAKEWLERTYQGREIVACHPHQLGDGEHDPWSCGFRQVDAVSRQYFDGTLFIYWVEPLEGRAVNGWMVAPLCEPKAKGRTPGIFIQVIPTCGNTLLQITAVVDEARFIRFIHCYDDGTEHCTHQMIRDVPCQVVLCEGEMGTIVVHGGTDEAPQEQKITFQIIDGVLSDMDNPHGFPLHVEVVI